MFVNTFIRRPILASVCSLVIILAGVVARQVFDLPFSADWKLVATSMTLGILASMAAGLAATRRVLSAPPTVVLRELQE